jgi:hypothetical protein
LYIWSGAGFIPHAIIQGEENMIRNLVASVIMLFLPLTSVSAQTVTSPSQTTIPNPLRGAQPTPAAQPKAAQPAAAANTSAAEPTKPKRERSAKQKQGDNDMKACGETWRAEKDALKAKGQTWRTYLKECRGQKKAARGA